MADILVIEDDKAIRNLLGNILEKSGYFYESADNGVDGLSMAMHKEYSMILMDLILPLKTGEELLRELRASKDTPVIIISAKCEVYNRIELLRLGADDYITKPFDIDEVILRIQAVLRRTQQKHTAMLQLRSLNVDTDSKRVFINENEVVCTATEFAILELLLSNPSKIFSKRNLFESITGEDYYSDDNTMNVHISNLRKKIGKYTDEEYIETVYGMGYRLKN